jgi:plasmid stabilization system protein ParE
MAKVVFRQEAINDFNNIWKYTYEKWSENQADKYYGTFNNNLLEYRFIKRVDLMQNNTK